MSDKTLFDPCQLGALTLSNRIVMAPMTRSRAGADDVPTALNVEYYRQRASAGLIVTEGAQPSLVGKGYCRTPGIYSAAQVAGWRAVTDAVHAEGGKIVVQLMHVGRVAHHFNKGEGVDTVAPSALTAKGDMFTEQGMMPLDAPRALALDEIPGIVNEYKDATECAFAAGFDGVELHCTSGYLPMQFLSTGSNKRNDAYGGDVSGRIRFAVEVLDAIAGVKGADRVGFRICPGNPFNDCLDDDPVDTYSSFLAAASALKLAYLHVIQSPLKDLDAYALAKQHFSGPLVLNESLDFESGSALVRAGSGEAVSYGRHFIGNPDLVERFRRGADLNKFDVRSLYTPGAKGYTDYPTL